MNIANYLKFGFTEELWYNEPYEIDHSLSFEDCVEGYKEYYEKAITSINTEGVICALSGGLDSSLNIWYLKDKNPLVYSYVIEGNLDHVYAERLAEEWGLERFFLVAGINLNKVDQLLVDTNAVWDEPRCVTGDIHTYDAYIKTKEHSDVLISGVGSEPMSLGIGWMYAPLIELAYTKKEYDVCLAKEIFKRSKYHDPCHDEQFYFPRILNNWKKTYTELIKELGVFSDEDIELLGIEPPNVKLREETLSHALQATYDWYNPNMIGKRYPKLQEKIGVTFISPYTDPDLRKFCFSMPVEFRFCMGSERHVMRQFIDDKLPQYIIDRPKEPFQPQVNWWFDNEKKLNPVFDKYLSKDNIIYDFINYDGLKKLFPRSNSYQKWTLLNLSIWLKGENVK